MVTTAVTLCHDAAEQHLCPRHDRKDPPNVPMHKHHNPPSPKSTLSTKHLPNPALLLFKMQLQARAQADLRDKHQQHHIREIGMNMRHGELPALVHVAQEVSRDE